MEQETETIVNQAAGTPKIKRRRLSRIDYRRKEMSVGIGWAIVGGVIFAFMTLFTEYLRSVI